MGWDVSERMVEALLAENVPGIDSKLKALLVFQHCTVHSLSLFDFLAKFRVDGLRVVPICDPPELMAAVYREPASEAEEESSVLNPLMSACAAEAVPDFIRNWSERHQDRVVRLEKLRLHLKEIREAEEQGWSAPPGYISRLKAYEGLLSRVVSREQNRSVSPDDAAAEVSDVAEELPESAFSVPADCRYPDWLSEKLAVRRLEKLRLHLREIQEGIERGQVWRAEYVDQLKSFEAALSRVVEPVPTLGLLPDDAAAEVSDVAEESPEQEPEAAESETSSDSLPVVPVSTEAEQAEIAAVLANPKAAQPVSAETRKDASGRVLVSDAKLEQIYKLGERLAMNRVQVQESLCAANKIRRIEDLPDMIADKIVKKMQDRIAAC